MKQENEQAIVVSNYSLKRSFQTETDYSVVINKRTKIDTVAKCPFKFERIPEIPVTKIKEVQKLPDYTVVSLYGKIDCSAAPEEVKLTGRSLTKQDCFIADDSDVIKLTLWEKQISAVENGKTYRIDNGRVRTYQGEKYVTLNTDSTVTLTNDKNFVTVPDFLKKSEELEVKSFILNKVDGIESLQRYARCKNCRRKVKSNEEKLYTCENCGLKQIVCESDKKYTSLSLLINFDDDNNCILTMFEDVIQQMLDIYNINETAEQTVKENVTLFSNNYDIMQAVLSVSNINITYNVKTNIISNISKNN